MVIAYAAGQRLSLRRRCAGSDADGLSRPFREPLGKAIIKVISDHLVANMVVLCNSVTMTDAPPAMGVRDSIRLARPSTGFARALRIGRQDSPRFDTDQTRRSFKC